MYSAVCKDISAASSVGSMRRGSDGKCLCECLYGVLECRSLRGVRVTVAVMAFFRFPYVTGLG